MLKRFLAAALAALALAPAASAQVTEAQAWSQIRDAAAAMATLKGAPVGTTPPVVVVPPPAAELTTAQKAVALASLPQPKVMFGSVTVPPTATVAYVPVTLEGELTSTVYVDVLTQNGSGALYAYEGGQFSRVDRLLTWKPGDPATQWVTIPLRATAKDGMWFNLYSPTSPQGAAKGVTVGRVTFKAGAPAQAAPPPYAAAPLRQPSKGALVYEFKASEFKASDAGGQGVYRTRLAHGRTQDANKEIGYYTDPALHPGAKPFEIRDGVLVLRAEKFATPMTVTIDGVKRTFEYGSSVLQANWLSQLYGYYEWEVQLPSARGTWEGLWLLPSNGSWPPEIDVSESPRNGAIGPGDTTASHHWGTSADHKAVTLQLNGRKIFGDPTLDFTTGFHTRAVDWREDWTTFYIDGVEVARYPTTFHKPAFPLMDVTVGGWGGAPDFSKGSTEMLVRAMRVYQ